MQSEVSPLTLQSLWRVKAARIISNITAPPFLAVPVYIVFGLYDQNLRTLPTNQTLEAVGTALFFGVIFPILFVIYLKSRNLVSDFHIPIREQRTLPYAASILSYIIGFGLVLWQVGGGALSAVMLCTLLASTIIMIINFWWKISAHATGVGAPLAALVLAFGWTIAPLFLLIPVVGWARVYLKAHTLGQVIAGTLFGFGFTAVLLVTLFVPNHWF